MSDVRVALITAASRGMGAACARELADGGAMRSACWRVRPRCTTWLARWAGWRCRAGAFVNISSFAAREPALTFPISAALRAALGDFAKLYAQRYGAAGLRMNNLLPGWIDTYPVSSETQRVIPAGRAGTAEEVAKVAAFLLSDDASHVNGESLLVDGGLVRTA